MGDYTPRLAKVANDELEAGEELLAGLRGMSAGSFEQMRVGGALGGAVGAVVSAKFAGKRRRAAEEAETQAALPKLPSAIALGLTDRRLLIFKRGGFTGKARELVAHIPRDSIASIEGEKGSRLGLDRLKVALKDGPVLEFDVIKADDFRRMVELAAPAAPQGAG